MYCEIDMFFKENMEHILKLAIDISRISSMTGQENEKAEFVKNKLAEICNA